MRSIYHEAAKVNKHEIFWYVVFKYIETDNTKADEDGFYIIRIPKENEEDILYFETFLNGIHYPCFKLSRENFNTYLLMEKTDE